MSVSKKAWSGVAVESPSGTAATTPTVYVPCKTKITNKTKYVYVTENRGARDANNKRLGTVRMAQQDVSGSWYNDTWPYFLLGFMGSDTPTQPDVTNNPTVWSHAMALVDTPPSLTHFKGYDIQGYYFAYSVVEKLKLTFAADGKLLDGNVTLQSQYGQKIASGSFSGMVPTYSNVNLFAGYKPTISLDSVASNAVEDMTLEFDTKLTLFYAVNGLRSFVKPYFGDRSAKLSFTASFDDTSMVDKFDADTDQHVAVSFVGDHLANQQTVAIPVGSSAGTFTLTYKGQTTAPIVYNATNTAVQTALRALSTIGTNCTVRGGPGPGTAWVVTFTGALAQDPTLLTGVGTGLTPSGAVTVTDSSLYASLAFDFPIVGWDSMDLETTKDYIQVKGAGIARPGAALNSTFTATVQNLVASYAL